MNAIENYRTKSDDDDISESSDGGAIVLIYRMTVNKFDMVYNWLSHYSDNNMIYQSNENKPGADFKFFRHHLLEIKSSNSYFF
jgi:hypothetical protein